MSCITSQQEQTLFNDLQQGTKNDRTIGRWSKLRSLLYGIDTGSSSEARAVGEQIRRRGMPGPLLRLPALGFWGHFFGGEFTFITYCRKRPPSLQNGQRALSGHTGTPFQRAHWSWPLSSSPAPGPKWSLCQIWVPMVKRCCVATYKEQTLRQTDIHIQ